MLRDIEVSNGKLYGVTSIIQGNTSGGKVESFIYEYDVYTKVFTEKLSFNSDVAPSGSLIKSSNGILYGTARNDDTDGFLYEFNAATLSYSIKKTFPSNSYLNEGGSPVGHLVEGETNVIYGMTFHGGIADQSRNKGGILCSFNLNNDTFSQLINFSSQDNVGSHPRGSLAKSNNGNLYGIISNHIFEYNTSTGAVSTKADTPIDHSYGKASRTLQLASDGKMYGVTNSGVIFNYDVSTGIVTEEVETNSDAETILLEITNGMFYGMVLDNRKETVNSEGAIFEFDSTNKTFKDLFSFGFENSRGGKAYGSLIEGENGKLYGLSSSGGVPSFFASGALFKYNKNTGYFESLHVFFSDEGGSSPKGSLLLADNNKFYGFTNYTMFEYDLTNNKYSELLDFSEIGGAVISKSTLIQASNGKIYGLLNKGGVNSDPVLFEYNTVSGDYSIKFDLGEFAFTPVIVGSLVDAGNDKLYAMTNGNSGRILEYDMKTEEMSVVFSFYRQGLGTKPSSTLLRANNGKLYATNYFGGANNDGTLFELNPIDNSIKVVYNYQDNTSSYMGPTGDLMQASNGKIYGKTSKGGINSYGSIYEYNLEDNTYTTKFSFSDTFGAYASNKGHLIELNPNTLGVGNSIKTKKNKLNVYPNPSNGFVNVDISSFEDATIKVYNILGKKIYTDENISGSKYSFELNNKPGVYFVEVSSSNKKEVVKLIRK